MEDVSLYLYKPIKQMVINELFLKNQSTSVDYAIMEKAKDMYVFPTNSPKNNASRSSRKNNM